MAVRRLALLGLLLNAVASLTAVAQTDPIAWHPNLEAAKAEAKQTGKLVLVHFWTEECAPCVALERNVFSQPEVANALSAQFVPVKLNANANSATASTMGVNRVPMDVIISPDGQVVGKLVSPATPMAYVAELTQVATRFHGQSGQAMQDAIAASPQATQNNMPAAPQPPQLNSVYAGLNLSTSVPAMPAGQSAAAPSAVGNRYATGAQFTAPPNLNLPAAPVAANAAPNLQNMVNAAPTGPPVQAAPPGMIENRYGQQAPAAMPYGGQSVANQFVGAAPQTAPAGPVAATQGAPANFGSSIATYPATAPPTAPPEARQLPPGSPPLGFEGYCPVSMRGEWKWVPGNPQFGAIHRGRTYWFAGSVQQQQFLANPDYYSPALSGIDPVLAIEHRQQVPGRREHSIDYDNLFYMFASEASLQQFTANPERYAASVRAAMGIQRGRSVR